MSKHHDLHALATLCLWKEHLVSTEWKTGWAQVPCSRWQNREHLLLLPGIKLWFSTLFLVALLINLFCFGPTDSTACNISFIISFIIYLSKYSRHSTVPYSLTILSSTLYSPNTDSINISIISEVNVHLILESLLCV